MAVKRLVLDVPEDLHRDFKMAAAGAGTTMNAKAAELIEAWCREQDAVRDRAAPLPSS